MTTVSGVLMYRERVALVPGGTATIQVIETSLRDPDAAVIAKTTFDLGSQQVPIPFALSLETRDPTAHASHAIGATISGPTNDLEWTTASPQPIDLYHGDVEIGWLMLVRAADDPASTADPSPIVGQWSITHINEAPVGAHSPATIVFEDDGTLAGSTGCNSYSTTYRTAGSLLWIDSRIATTLMACDPATEQQERVVLGVLNAIAANSASLEINGAANELRLTSSDGGTIDAVR